MPFGAHCSLDHLQAVIPGVVAIVRRATVNHDGQLCAGSQFHLAREDFFLGVARRVIVVIIQPDFAPGNHLRMPCQSLHLGIGVV